MTTPQGQVPPPPEGYASWLDKIVSRDWNGHDCVAAAHARAELAALRKELSDAKANWHNLQSVHDDAEKECRLLRKELSTTQGLLATAQQNLVAMDAQRAEAVRERDSFKQHMQLAHFAAAETTQEREKYRHAARQFCGGHIGVSQSKCPACERDALRAQVAEMREAILGLGEIREFQVRLEFNRAQLDCGRADAKKFNALVTKLRAEPAPKEEKQP